VASKPQGDFGRGAEGDGGDDEWLTQGHPFVGQRVRRSILDQRKTKSADVDGTVIGWLPAHMSNYFRDDDPKKPAALWRVQYDDAAVGQEDLEYSEVLDAAEMFKSAMFKTAAAESVAGAAASALGNMAALAVAAAQPPRAVEADDEWWTKGSEYVGRRVRRFILSDEGQVLNTADAVVRGWLPSHVSNFLIEATGEPVAAFPAPHPCALCSLCVCSLATCGQPPLLARSAQVRLLRALDACSSSFGLCCGRQVCASHALTRACVRVSAPGTPVEDPV